MSLMPCFFACMYFPARNNRLVYNCVALVYNVPVDLFCGVPVRKTPENTCDALVYHLTASPDRFSRCISVSLMPSRWCYVYLYNLAVACSASRLPEALKILGFTGLCSSIPLFSIIGREQVCCPGVVSIATAGEGVPGGLTHLRSGQNPTL